MMSKAALRLSAEAASPSSPDLSSSKKPRSLSKSQSSPVPPFSQKSTGRKNLSIQRHTDSPIKTRKQLLSNERNLDSRVLVVEERILKRGEVAQSLSPFLSSAATMGSATPCLTDRLGPDPKFLPTLSASVYASPAFFSSPSPSSLPVPLFLKKAASRGEEVTTRSLRCLLRLDA